MPVLPEVESMIVFPGASLPDLMPSWIILSAGRSLTEPPGLKPSSLAKILTAGEMPAAILRISSSGVSPISSRTDSIFFGSLKRSVASQRAAEGLAIKCSGKRLPAGDRGNDRDVIAFLERSLEILEKTDVVAVDI